jgi:hypothetical protein
VVKREGKEDRGDLEEEGRLDDEADAQIGAMKDIFTGTKGAQIALLNKRILQSVLHDICLRL